MRRTTIIALAAVCALGASVPAGAGPLRHRARALYAEGRAQLGPEGVGRNIVRDGYRTRSGVRKPRKAELRAFIATLDRKVHPPVLKPMRTLRTKSVSYSIPAPSTSTPTSSGDGGGGYCGAYQFDAQTWHSVGGTGTACGASPAEQNRRAAMLQQQRGNAPWPVCGRGGASLAQIRQCENSGSYK